MNTNALFDVGIVVALNEEFTTLKKAIGEWDELPPIDQFTYYRTEVVSKSAELPKRYQVVFTFCNAMGPVAGHEAAAAMVRHFSPQIVILTGIAGGSRRERATG